ncbi:peptidase A4 family-domain-containing protein [Chaetomidium leptoderma]|uniref:Peptidase A4 family-domain-containing protein n=1 Tax=Chaetomidium leptoderma TaxID=669021 RepID=A0AAN6VPU4_9PEZI|nr:peptidase A4 family-domain-containing protein [Chaetomidium leptoderma]
MKLATVLHAVLLGSNTIFALRDDPTTDPPLPSIRRSRLSDGLKTLFFAHEDRDTTPPTVAYNQNCAGAVLTGAGYRSVTGTLQIPSIKLPPGANRDKLHAVSAWIGIDGEHACPNSMLQVGVDMYLNNSISQYWAWFEWFPNHSTYLTDFAIRAGDTLTMNITAASLSSAEFAITNHRTGQRDSATLTDPAAAAAAAPLLCGFSTEWMVEDFSASDGVPLVDFGGVAFTGAQFATDSGVTGGVEAAEMAGVKETADGQVVIECEKVGGDEVTCLYRGDAGTNT